MNPKIIFEDEWMVVVEKPAGMVTNNSQTSNGSTVQEWFRPKLKVESGELKVESEFRDKGGVVHRLDKDTSGLLVLARTPQAYENLKTQFLERKTKKTYLALVHGETKQEQGIINLPMVRNPKAWGKFMIGEDLSKTAITEYTRNKIYELRNMNKIEKFTFLEIQPLTGRTHQIRVHMKHLGHPIVSDPLYLGRKQLIKDLEWCPRLFLHAGGLELKHPVNSKQMGFRADLPGDLAKALEKLVH